MKPCILEDNLPLNFWSDSFPELVFLIHSWTKSKTKALFVVLQRSCSSSDS